MKVRLTNKGAGLLRNRICSSQRLVDGSVVDLPESVAVELIASECAERVGEPTDSDVETAAVAPPENTARRTTKPRPRRQG